MWLLVDDAIPARAVEPRLRLDSNFVDRLRLPGDSTGFMSLPAGERNSPGSRI